MWRFSEKRMSDAATIVQPVAVFTAPVILLGMHRSGTSLIARLLDELGLFQGHELQEDHESTHFLEINEVLLRRAGATWDNPGPMRGFLENPRAADLTLRCLREDLAGRQVAGYLGKKRFGKTRGLAGFERPWGWKDPRTVFTLPLWLKLFPEARLVYIVRNGVDVASSLRVREARELTRRIEEFDAKLKKTGRLTKHSLLERAGFKGSARCLTLDGAFSLWEEYVTEAERQLAAAPNERLVLNYEQFLADPKDPNNGLAALVKFCGLAAPADALDGAIKNINTGRARAFLADAELSDFYARVKDTEWMKQYGYSKLLEATASNG
jgi:hypothetical protein